MQIHEKDRGDNRKGGEWVDGPGGGKGEWGNEWTRAVQKECERKAGKKGNKGDCKGQEKGHAMKRSFVYSNNNNRFSFK